jgi:hypothetical protein
MPTLSEYAKLANDKVDAGVLINIFTADELSRAMQFESFEGNALKYQRENALPTTTTHAVGDTWQDTEATYTRKSAELTILGLQSPLDRYVLQTRSDVQSQEAVLFAGMAKSVGRKIGQLLIQGEPEATTTEFEGLDSLARADTRMMAMDDGNVDGPGTVETELTLDRLDAAIDQVEDGAPDALIMNKTMRRKLTQLSRATGSGVLMSQIDFFGKQILQYDGINILISDFITNGEIYNDSGTWPSSTATTIFAVKFGKEKQGISMLHNGPVLKPDVQPIGIKDNKNENLYRMVVYTQVIARSAKMYIALGGIDSAA